MQQIWPIDCLPSFCTAEDGRQVKTCYIVQVNSLCICTKCTLLIILLDNCICINCTLLIILLDNLSKR